MCPSSLFAVGDVNLEQLPQVSSWAPRRLADAKWDELFVWRAHAVVRND